MSFCVCKMTGCRHCMTWWPASTTIKTICWYIYIDLSRHIVDILLLRWLHQIILFKDWYAVSVQLCMLYCTSLHVQLLIVNLLHLVLIGLFDEGFDSIKFTRTSCWNAHIVCINITGIMILIVMRGQLLGSKLLRWWWWADTDTSLWLHHLLMVNTHALLVLNLLSKYVWLVRGPHIIVLVHVLTSVIGWLLDFRGVSRLLLVMMGADAAALDGHFLAQNFRKHLINLF